MHFSPNNFLTLLKQIVTGGGLALSGSSLKSPDGGFLKDASLDVGDFSPAGSTVTLTTASSGLQILSAAANTTLIGTISFVVPRDYDQADDKLIIRAVMNMGGATDTPTITLASSTQAVTTSTSGLNFSYGSTYGTLTAGTSKVSPALSATLTVYEFDLSSQLLKRDTIVSLKFTAGAHTTDAVQVYAINAVYSSDVVAYGDIQDKDALGIYLRG